MFGLLHGDGLPAKVRDEFDHLYARLRGWTSKEHNADGSHRLGLWLPYDVVWEGAPLSGAQPAIGDGRLTGRYTRIGNTVSVAIRLYVGATTDPGASANAWQFGLPFPVAVADYPVHIGVAGWANGSQGIALFRGQRVYAYDFSNVWGSDDPFPSAANDILYISGQYEAVSLA